MSDFSYNMDYEKRDKLLGVAGEWGARRGSGNIRRFEYIDVSILKQLMDNKYIDPLDSQNSSPSVEQIHKFMTKFPHVLAKGHAISPLRKDYRVSLDTLFVRNEHVTNQLRQEFIAFCLNTDEIETEGNLFAWWD